MSKAVKKEEREGKPGQEAADERVSASGATDKAKLTKGGRVLDVKLRDMSKAVKKEEEEEEEEEGADKNAKDSNGDSPLLLAVRRGQLSMVKTLLSAGANCGSGDNSALIAAAIENHVPIMKAILKHGEKPNIRDSRGDTALCIVASFDQIGAIPALVEAGAHVNLRSANTGLTPLHVAAEWSNLVAMKALLEKGAYIDSRDPVFGFTPLHNACIMHRPGVAKVVELLLNWGADEKARDGAGETPSSLLKHKQDGPCCSKEEIERARALLAQASEKKAQRRRSRVAEKAKKAEKAKEAKKAPQQATGSGPVKKALVAARGQKRGRSARSEATEEKDGGVEPDVGRHRRGSKALRADVEGRTPNGADPPSSQK